MEELLKKVGSWLFIVGLIIAVISGVAIGASGGFDQTSWNTTVGALLAVLGLVIGVLSFFAMGTITKDKVPTFLIGALMLVGLGYLGQSFNPIWTFGTFSISDYFTAITTCIAVLVAPAAGLMAIRAIWDSAKGEEIDKLISKK